MNNTSIEPYMEVTRYLVSVVPAESADRHTWGITVEQRCPGRWAVVRGSLCYGSDGEWAWEPTPSSRTAAWADAHRFDLATALEIRHVVHSAEALAAC